MLSGEGCKSDRNGLLAATIVLLVAPILTTPYLPLVDLPNHLGRASILSSYGSNTLFQGVFTRSLAPIPNIAVDLVVSPMIGFLGPSWAARVFITGMALLFGAGALLLGRALLGHYSLLAIPIVLFFYSSPLFYGFVNYMAGVAVFMLALGHWLAHRRSASPGFLFVSSLATLAAYFTHLTSYAALVVAMLWFSFVSLVRNQNSRGHTAVRLLPLLPPALAFLLFMHGDGRVGVIEWNTLAGKVVGLLPLIVGYDYSLDLMLAAMLLLGVLYVCWRLGRPAVAWDGAALGAIFILLFVLSPKALLSASAVDSRWVLPGLMLLMLSMDARSPQTSPNPRPAVGRSLAFVLMMFQAARISSVLAVWHSLSRATEEQLSTIVPQIAKGSSVYSLYAADPRPQVAKWQRAWSHNPHYATVLRGAVVSNPFAIRGQQPLYLRSPEALPQFRGTMAAQVAAASMTYDYIWFVGVIDSAIARQFAVRCRAVVQSAGAALCLTEGDRILRTAPRGETQ